MNIIELYILITLVAIALLASTFCHLFIRNYIAACITAAIVTPILFSGTLYFIFQFREPFSYVIFLVGALVAFVMASISGIPTRILRSKTAEQGAAANP
jgi:hypothetical protein